VVFVHGYSADVGGSMSAYITGFRAAGWPAAELHEFRYPSLLAGARPAARDLATAVTQLLARTGKDKVDIVAHSEGNLVSETCIVLGGCAGKVHRWINLTGAQNGTWLAGLAVLPNSSPTDMNPAGALVRELNGKERAALSAQGVQTIVFWTPTDTIIIPGDLSRESFAVRNVQFVGNHFTILADASIVQQSIRFATTGA
jgi:triacylglycerol esterase/lipase EstA (alpha/beta hydrolase family)